MPIPFTEFYKRLKRATGIRTQMDLAAALGVHRSAITQAKTRDAVPDKWILALARHFTLSPDWLEYGKGEASAKTPAASPVISKTVTKAQAVAPSPELVYVPKVRARLCAGGGSFEIEAVPVAEHPFPRQWLSRMGTPSSMVFMDVMGASMEPTIYDGDTVLVDQSGVRLTAHAVYAVGFEDSIYIKRVTQQPTGIVLHSDNPAYSDMKIFGDELESFRVLGKVVWLCRDL